MDRLHVFAARLLGLFRKRRIDENLDAELRAHLQLLTEENMRRGSCTATSVGCRSSICWSKT
jgi:hypothetical protein